MMKILFAANTPSYGSLLVGVRAAWLGAAVILSGFSLPAHSDAQSDPLTVLSHGNLSGPLVEALDGNFYGEYFGGQIFRLTPGGTVNVIYTFAPVDPNTGTNANGVQPDGGLLLGKDGNLYGTTYQGGANGYGTVFRITTAGVLTTLANFTIKGYTHPGPLVEDSHGNLYGVTETGGNVDAYRTDGYGYVFEVTAAGQLGTVHLFTAPDAGTSYDANTYDGAEPMSGLAITSTDLIYGTTTIGGTNTTGTVFQFGSGGGGFAVIYNFDPAESGTTPSPSGTGTTGPLAVAKDDSVYGTTETGGAGFNGAVFKISGGGYNVIYSFSASAKTGNNSDGSYPHGISVGKDGNLYGTTTYAGPNGAGTIYQLTPAGDLKVLYSFTSGQTNGLQVEVPPLEASNGNLYGGGPVNMGANALYELESLPLPFFEGQVSLGSGVYYLGFPNGNYFGYYSYLSDPNYIYHFDLGYEYVFDAADGKDGVYFYDFASKDFFYTSPTFPFPYLYDFNLKTVLYYYPNPTEAGRYNTNGIRYFYDFATGEIITK